MTARTLDLGGLRLPADSAATEAYGVVGVRGSGKTTTARVLAEELTDAGQPCAIVDPIGVWWGLRLAADGMGPGLPFTILGGDHADLPLDAHAGEVVADLLVDQPAPLVLDLSHLRKGAQRQFMTAFCERLYERNRRPLHLVVDEADLYAPQRPIRGAERLLGAMEDLVRRGRARGLGVTLVTQRPAVLHKDLLSQVGCLVAHRLVGPQDRAALDAWVQANGTREQRDLMLATLASLPTGTAWWWSPSWLGIFERAEVRAPRTFDSSATPRAGGRRAELAALAPVDLDALKARLAAVVQRAEADDPRALRRRVAELRAELARDRAGRPAPEVRVERVEVPVVNRALLEGLRAALDPVVAAAEAIEAAARGVQAAAELLEGIDQELARPTTTPSPLARGNGRPGPAPTRSRPAPPPEGSGGPAPGPPARPGGQVELKAGARGLLEVLARHSPVAVTRAQLATLAGRGVRSSSFDAQLRGLLHAGLVAQQGALLSATDAGLAEAGVERLAPQTSQEVIEVWRRALPGGPAGGPARMFDELVAAYPGTLARDELARRAGFSPTSSSPGAHLKVLRDNNLAEVRGGEVRASGTLFEVAVPS